MLPKCILPLGSNYLHKGKCLKTEINCLSKQEMFNALKKLSWNNYLKNIFLLLFLMCNILQEV